MYVLRIKASKNLILIFSTIKALQHICQIYLWSKFLNNLILLIYIHANNKTNKNWIFDYISNSLININNNNVRDWRNWNYISMLIYKNNKTITQLKFKYRKFSIIRNAFSNKERVKRANSWRKKMIRSSRKKLVLQLFRPRSAIDVPQEYFEPTPSPCFAVSVHYSGENCRSGLPRTSGCRCNCRAQDKVECCGNSRQ